MPVTGDPRQAETTISRKSRIEALLRALALRKTHSSRLGTAMLYRTAANYISVSVCSVRPADGLFAPSGAADWETTPPKILAERIRGRHAGGRKRLQRLRGIGLGAFAVANTAAFLRCAAFQSIASTP
jgi:hypothetical protein